MLAAQALPETQDLDDEGLRAAQGLPSREDLAGYSLGQAQAPLDSQARPARRPCPMLPGPQLASAACIPWWLHQRQAGAHRSPVPCTCGCHPAAGACSFPSPSDALKLQELTGEREVGAPGGQASQSLLTAQPLPAPSELGGPAGRSLLSAQDLASHTGWASTQDLLG